MIKHEKKYVAFVSGILTMICMVYFREHLTITWRIISAAGLVVVFYLALIYLLKLIRSKRESKT